MFFSNALQQELQVTNNIEKCVQMFQWRTLYTQVKRSIIDVRRDTKCRYIVSKNNSSTITESECHNSPFAHLPKSNTEDCGTASFRKEKQTKAKNRILEDNNVTTDAHLSISLFFSFINISCSLLNLVLKAKKVVMLC